jgi:poly-beta-1,6-N-acetyl-D-glucosamine biosynthesis protein PgaD
MEKSGPRPADTKIIDKPELKTPFRNILEGTITIILWSAWIYFIIPALTAVLWIVGIRHLWGVLYQGGGFSQLLWLLKSAGVVILIVFALDMVWMGFSHYLHYRMKVKKQTFRPACLDADLARFFGLNPEDVLKAKKSHRISLVMKDNKVTIISA